MLIRLILLSVLITGGWQLGSGGWIWAKAWLAQQLLEQSWQAMRNDPEDNQAIKPWPWADTHARGQLRIPALEIEQIVLDGDSGRTLAFGPGLSHAGSGIGQPGTTIISGHRDTHFAFLSELDDSMDIQLQGLNGLHNYRVLRTEIIDTSAGEIRLDMDQDGLLLVTCYPFDNWQPRGPLRYLVWAEPVEVESVKESGDEGEAYAGSVLQRAFAAVI